MLKNTIRPRKTVRKNVEKGLLLFAIFLNKNLLADIHKTDQTSGTKVEQSAEKKSAIDKLAPSQQSGKFLAISKLVELYANVLGEIGKSYYYNINFDEINDLVIKAIEDELDLGTEVFLKTENLFKKGQEIESSLTLGFEIEERKSNSTTKNFKEREGKDKSKKVYSGIVCSRVYRESPASKSGLQKGDLILKVGNIDVLNKSEEEFINIIRSASLPMEVSVAKATGEVKRIFFGKEKLKIKSVVYKEILEKEIGYIRIAEFSTGLSQEFRQAISTLKSLGASKIIIDLRGNFGGHVDELIQVLDQLVEPDTIVLKAIARSGEILRQYKTGGDIYDTRTPLVVLIDQDTASAAEIFAGVLQDLDRAVIIGKNSYGKGTIQVMRDLPYGYAIKLTTSRYALPSGRYVLDDISNRPSKPFKARQFKTKKGRNVYEMRGITPDISVEEKSPIPLIMEIIKSGAIDQYAREFISKREIKNIQDFSLTESQLSEGMNWLAKNQEFYRHEQDLDRMFLVLKEYGYGEGIKTHQQGLKHQLQKARLSKFIAAKPEIKKLLEEAIIEQKFFYEGYIEYTIKTDQKVQRAIRILKRLEEYERILSN